MKIKDKKIQEVLALYGQAQAEVDSEKAYLKHLRDGGTSKLSTIYKTHVDILSHKAGQQFAYSNVVRVLGLL